MARPNPSVSNCGLVIVQVEQPPNRPPYSTEAQRNYHYSPPQPHHEQAPLTNWSNITLDNRIFLTESNVASTASGGKDKDIFIFS